MHLCYLGSSRFVEAHERMFGQMKQITKATSNYHPNNVITNALICMHEEGKVTGIDTQESEVGKIAQTLGRKKNSVIPQSWCNSNSSQYQAHLEQIGDYLVPGPGIWWQETSNGFEFFDGDDSDDHHKEGPSLQHYRSVTLMDVDLHLHNKLEECLHRRITLPAPVIRHYTSEGQLSKIEIHSECGDSAANEGLATHNRLSNGKQDAEANTSPTSDLEQTSSVPTHGLILESNTHFKSVSGSAKEHPLTYKGLLPHSDLELNSNSATKQEKTPANPLPSDGSDHTCHNYTTTLVKTLAHVLQSGDLLMQYDKLRSLAKSKGRVPLTQQRRLIQLSQIIKSLFKSMRNFPLQNVTILS